MDRWARLTWQAGDPAQMAQVLGERLGIAPTPSRRAAGAWDLRLGTELLEVVLWRSEQAGDEPTAEGRLLFEPVMQGGSSADDAHDPDLAAARQQSPSSVTLAAVIWATVDLERAEAELALWLEPLANPAPLTDEPHLGARGRVRTTTGLPGGRLVLLEPTSEGALAASLARDSEGPCGLYVLGAPMPLGSGGPARRHDGPIGASVRLRTAVRAGPHLLLLVPGTIAP